MRRSRLCAACGKPNNRHKRYAYCSACHAAYQRRWRKKLKAERQAIARFLRRQGLDVSRVTSARAA